MLTTMLGVWLSRELPERRRHVRRGQAYRLRGARGPVRTTEAVALNPNAFCGRLLRAALATGRLGRCVGDRRQPIHGID